MVRDFPNSTDQLASHRHPVVFRGLVLLPPHKQTAWEATDQADEIALTILSGVSSANRAEKAWKRRIHSNGKEFSAVLFRWKERSTSELVRATGRTMWTILHNFLTEFPSFCMTETNVKSFHVCSVNVEQSCHYFTSTYKFLVINVMEYFKPGE